MYQTWTKTALTSSGEIVNRHRHLQVEGSGISHALGPDAARAEVVMGLRPVEVKTAVQSKASSAYQTPVNGPK